MDRALTYKVGYKSYAVALRPVLIDGTVFLVLYLLIFLRTNSLLWLSIGAVLYLGLYLIPAVNLFYNHKKHNICKKLVLDLDQIWINDRMIAVNMLENIRFVGTEYALGRRRLGRGVLPYDYFFYVELNLKDETIYLSRIINPHLIKALKQRYYSIEKKELLVFYPLIKSLL